MTVDGTVDRGEIVFAPGAVRVTELPVEVGQQVAPGQPVLKGTSDVRVVTVALEADSVDLVAVDLPEGSSSWEQAPVEVRITRQSRENVLAVPVNALVALLEGGYAVERVDSNGTSSLVGVELGIFQDGWVEIRTDGLDEGDTVAVPS